MKFLAIMFLSLLTSAAQAAIECKATVTEILADGTQRREEAVLKTEVDNGHDIILSAELDGRAFVLSGNHEDQVYMLSITWGPDFRIGSLTTGSFSPKGRLQISTVNNSLVHKVECFKK